MNINDTENNHKKNLTKQEKINRISINKSQKNILQIKNQISFVKNKIKNNFNSENKAEDQNLAIKISKEKVNILGISSIQNQSMNNLNPIFNQNYINFSKNNSQDKRVKKITLSTKNFDLNLNSAIKYNKISKRIINNKEESGTNISIVNNYSTSNLIKKTNFNQDISQQHKFLNNSNNLNDKFSYVNSSCNSNSVDKFLKFNNTSTDNLRTHTEEFINIFENEKNLSCEKKKKDENILNNFDSNNKNIMINKSTDKLSNIYKLTEVNSKNENKNVLKNKLKKNTINSYLTKKISYIDNNFDFNQKNLILNSLKKELLKSDKNKNNLKNQTINNYILKSYSTKKYNENLKEKNNFKIEKESLLNRYDKFDSNLIKFNKPNDEKDDTQEIIINNDIFTNDMLEDDNDNDNRKLEKSMLVESHEFLNFNNLNTEIYKIQNTENDKYIDPKNFESKNVGKLYFHNKLRKSIKSSIEIVNIIS